MTQKLHAISLKNISSDFIPINNELNSHYPSHQEVEYEQAFILY